MLKSHSTCDERTVRAVVEGLEGRVLMCVDDAILSQHTTGGGDMGPTLEARRAVAELTSAAGMNVRGEIEFKAVPGGVLVKADVRGLTPGSHGFHVHAGAQCGPPDSGFTAAGPHFANPTTEPHGAPNSAVHHDGDMGNLVADNRGRAKMTLLLRDVSLTGANGFVGHTVIIHASPDDLTTQPTGNSGARVACGFIQAVSRGNDGHGHDDDHGGRDDDDRGGNCPKVTLARIGSALRRLFQDLFD